MMAIHTLLLALLLFASVEATGDPDTQYWAATTVVTETIFENVRLALTTSIILPNAVLTSVVVQPPTSPASCYSLPTPTESLDVVAFAASQVSASSEPVFFYVGNNATSPEYVGTFIDGNRVLLDISPDASAAGRVAMILSSGESIVFDSTGVHHFDANCQSVASVVIPGFMDQVLAVAESPVHMQRRSYHTIQKREMEQQNFTVAVRVENVIDQLLREPDLAFGPSACGFVSRDVDGEWAILSWTCQYPGAESAEKACEQSFHSWLRPNFSSLAAVSGEINNGDDLFNYLPHFFTKVGGSLMNLIPGLTPVLQKGLKWLTVAQEAVLDVAELGGESVCELLHAFDEYPLIFKDPGLETQHTIGKFISPPVPTISGTIASRTTKVTKEPPRAMQPTVTDFPTVTETSFTVTTLPSGGSMISFKE
ncbi:hypothetical protein QBC41DRAFT_356792 [Cercophora samala]|uniref:Uncharacterized protein n=1 Tax=Cercophora samala TaxID=330535 RepID=A0AA39ZC24_9PEZI|nr:hypothetical protein QBC41DRAFT_356792 [Cercophora samala]